MILMSEKMTSQNKLYEIKSVPYNKSLLPLPGCSFGRCEAYSFLIIFMWEKNMICTIQSHPWLFWMVQLQIITIDVYFILSIFIS